MGPQPTVGRRGPTHRRNRVGKAPDRSDALAAGSIAIWSSRLTRNACYSSCRESVQLSLLSASCCPWLERLLWVGCRHPLSEQRSLRVIEHPLEERLTRQRLRWRNIALAVFLALGIAVAALNPYPVDPLRPYLIIAGWAIWFKLLLEVVFGLPMRWLYVNLWPNQRSARGRAIVGLGAVLAVLTFVAFRM